MPIPGPMELILLLVIVLIIFGPGKLPDIGNAVGKGSRVPQGLDRDRGVRPRRASEILERREAGGGDPAALRVEGPASQHAGATVRDARGSHARTRRR